jgi:hypothetical protein
VIGLQTYSYDIEDEGPEVVVEHALLAAADVLLPQIVSEPNLVAAPDEVPDSASQVEVRLGPGGRLPHNPRRDYHRTDGGANFEPEPKLYPQGLVPRRSAEMQDAETALKDLQGQASTAGVRVVPWVILLNQAIAYESPEHCVVNVFGDVVNGWLCPNHPDTAAFVKGLLEDVIDRFGPEAVFIDRIRFPEWGERGLVDVCTCFCSRCERQARAEGVELGEARDELVNVLGALADDPAGVSTSAEIAFASGLRGIRFAAAHPALAQWLVFRQRAIERLVTMATSVTNARGVRLWLDVWPPSYGWLLGQDLARLTRYAEWTKPFTYHRVAGGANIAEFIAMSSSDESDQEMLYRAYRALFRFPGPDSFREFARSGLHPAFITEETQFAAHLLGAHSKLAAGLQLWQMGPDGVREALEHAALAHPDGVFFHCHGWATLDELEAAGNWLKENDIRTARPTQA